MRPIKWKGIFQELKSCNKTRPDTWQSSRGQLGRSSSAKTAQNSKMLRHGPTDRRTETARCPRLKMSQNNFAESALIKGLIFFSFLNVLKKRSMIDFIFASFVHKKRVFSMRTFMNFNRPMREWAKWVSQSVNKRASKTTRAKRSAVERANGVSDASEWTWPAIYDRQCDGSLISVIVGLKCTFIEKIKGRRHD